MKKWNIQLILFVCIIICFDIFTGYLVIGRNMRFLHEENGLLENMQVVLLSLTILVFAMQLWMKKRSHPVFPLAGAYLCAVFVLRELDVEELDVPNFLIQLGSGIGRNIILVVLGGLLAGYALKKQKIIRTFLPAFFFETSSLTIFVGLLFLVSGWPFDKGIIHTEYYQFYEEIFELTGYYLMFAGAVLGLRETP